MINNKNLQILILKFTIMNLICVYFVVNNRRCDYKMLTMAAPMVLSDKRGDSQI